MNGPGDRALKHNFSGVPTHCLAAEGHDESQLDEGRSYTPESQSSARSQLLPAREPGDLDGASSPVVGEKRPREGDVPHAVAPPVEESDAGMVPKKSAKTRVTPVESVEGRPAAKGKSVARNTSPTQRGTDVPTALQRIGQRAKEKPKEKWTNLLNHLRVPLLTEAYRRLRRDAATGVDAVTWAEYGERLDERLRHLEDRIHRGSYHPQPVRRVYIPKGDGRMRPLGIPALEDKIVQQAVRWLLEPIYEAEFLGLSYGFRPGRSPHDALDALAVAIDREVRWVLDADIRSFFDTIDHGWMQRFLEHRIGDSRLVRLLMKWMHAGVMEDGELRQTQAGTPQGGLISPLLANVYLHYALDLWVTSWRSKHARGAVYFVRYADDFVMGFQFEQDARAMLSALAERLAKFGLELHPEKTRVLQFGRFAREDRARRGLPRPETFDFLGFTHISGLSRSGRFQLKRRTSRKKRRASLARLKEECRRRRHDPVVEQRAWLTSVLRGHYRYYGVPTNSRALGQFQFHVERMWYRSLQRRSQRGRWNDAEHDAFRKRHPLPPPRIHHPWPSIRFAAR
jgi:group II intron reverse transcriptase/maturase